MVVVAGVEKQKFEDSDSKLERMCGRREITDVQPKLHTENESTEVQVSSCRNIASI